MGVRCVRRWSLAIAAAMLLMVGLSSGARAQAVPNGGYASSYRVSDTIVAPGLYGTSYGFPSYGMPQTYSVFSSMPGPSYGTNYPPYGLMPGKFGVGLWRPGYVAPGYVYGASYYPSSFSYRTFPAVPGAIVNGRPITPAPPIGVYAPALGPATLYGW
jgi:hypothetical protein